MRPPVERLRVRLADRCSSVSVLLLLLMLLLLPTAVTSSLERARSLRLHGPTWAFSGEVGDAKRPRDRPLQRLVGP